MRSSPAVRGLMLFAIGAASVAVLSRSTARACGGLFCNSSQSVNQAAERILFVHNQDGTMRMVVEVQYQGPAERFSWVLPVAGVPEVAVSSSLAFDRLQQATNPSYSLQTRVEGECRENLGVSGRIARDTATASDRGGGVVVEAAGRVGPYDYEVISVDSALEDVAQVATDWLTDNGYDLFDDGPALLRPYLEEGLNLLAFRLTKGNDTGSIRPIVISFPAQTPSIPLTLTAVAARDDMGILLWVVSEARAIPLNYKALELNEALIDWFNPGRTYDQVVSAAADEAGGQGFVTELAGATADTVEGVVFSSSDTRAVRQVEGSTGLGMLIEAVDAGFLAWDGFAEVVEDSVTLPQEITLDELLGCPACFRDRSGLEFDEAAFVSGMHEHVIEPMQETQLWLKSRPYVTRMYTTMSAAEMTMDPVFGFAQGLSDVSNVHTAERVIECSGSITQAAAPYRIELPQGDVVRGQDQGVWPIEMGSSQPAAREIYQLSESGERAMIEDNKATIASLLAEHNATVAGPPDDCGCRVVGRRSAPAHLWVGLVAVGVVAGLGRRRVSRAALGRRPTR